MGPIPHFGRSHVAVVSLFRLPELWRSVKSLELSNWQRHGCWYASYYDVHIFKGLRLTAGRRPSNDFWLMVWEDWAEILRANRGRAMLRTQAGIMRSACLYGSSLGLCWALVVLCWALVVPMLGQVGSMLSHRLMLGHVGRMLSHVGPIFGLYWPRLGLCWAMLGPSWAHVGPMLGSCWPM